MTAQIVAFKIKDFALPVLALGVLFVFLGVQTPEVPRQRSCGIRLLFPTCRPWRPPSLLGDQKEIFIAFSRSPLLGLFMGTVVTMIVQAARPP